ncbi:MAG: MIT C-terminal domain-containing protein, partial [Bullifex sp.]
DNIRSEMFSTSYGFVIDYLAEMFRYMRDLDYSSLYRRWFSLSDSISTRDREGINKTFSGLAKLMYPDGEVTKSQAEELLLFAIESRKRVKDQMLRMDSTFAIPEFSCSDTESGKTITVMTAEEKQYAELYDKEAETIKPEKTSAPVSEPAHLVSPDGAMGISYDRLFGKYLEGAGEITVQDPYILTWMQVRNFLEFLNVIARRKKPEDEVTVNLITTKSRSEEEYISQITNLDQLKQEFILQGIKLNYTLDDTGKLHARSITTDTGWKIILDRGLDIFGRFNVRDTLSVTASLQEARKCRAFEMTVIKV